MTYLLLVYHIRLGKNCTPPRDPDGPGDSPGQPAEFLDRNAEPLETLVRNPGRDRRVKETSGREAEPASRSAWNPSSREKPITKANSNSDRRW